MFKKQRFNHHQRSVQKDRHYQIPPTDKIFELIFINSVKESHSEEKHNKKTESVKTLPIKTPESIILSGKKSPLQTGQLLSVTEVVLLLIRDVFSRAMHTVPHDSNSTQYYFCYFTSEIAFLISSDVRRSLANL